MIQIIKFSFLVYLSVQTLILSGQTPEQLNAEIKEVVIGLEDLDLQTGDLIFFQNRIIEGVLINIGTLSHLTHVAMVVKDPEDGSLWLTHATDNSYNGTGVPVRNEAKPRNGVIMTRLQSSFISTNDQPTGFYKKIWIYRLNEKRVKRPASDKVTDYYEKNKHLKFETNYLRFLFPAYDLYFFGKDLIAFEENDKRICSEYVHQLMIELGFPVEKNQQSNEYTPGDICYMITPIYRAPKLFTFRDGAYRLTEY